ncbi:MAG: hypothetical protein KJO67_15165 [Silicimonas sp.]|nr:hypothetical protein [Silicimonas sp.]
MSDFARLEDKLAKLRQRERIAGEGRRLRGASPETLLAAVVAEIDETILPRRLTFKVEGGASVHLAVANRRLQALASPVPELDGVASAGLADHPLPDAEEPGVAQVRDVLLAAFADAAPVAIQSSRPSGKDYPSDIGVPSNILARVWGISELEDETLTADALVSRFLEGLGNDAIAWLRIEGESVTDQGGDASAIEELGDHAAVFLDGYFGRFEMLHGDETGALATMIGPVGTSGASVIFVEAGEVTAFVSAHASHAPRLVADWQKLARV